MDWDNDEKRPATEIPKSLPLQLILDVSLCLDPEERESQQQQIRNEQISQILQ